MHILCFRMWSTVFSNKPHISSVDERTHKISDLVWLSLISWFEDQSSTSDENYHSSRTYQRPQAAAAGQREKASMTEPLRPFLTAQYAELGKIIKLTRKQLLELERVATGTCQQILQPAPSSCCYSWQTGNVYRLDSFQQKFPSVGNYYSSHDAIITLIHSEIWCRTRKLMIRGFASEFISSVGPLRRNGYSRTYLSIMNLLLIIMHC